ncbi:MAG: zinc-ribbon domain-containing protein [Dehalogenimonas sp.]|uniref:Zinc-ribbon domain-containing protein n=1 Tax=Candidatus Dehalogenimonas loeffleri TaxID=3127115 RepID=A0ABZ2J323_9CHLR|nr:zinc-ribbon domain-containing protein [Dehalogenimonas sp.]
MTEKPSPVDKNRERRHTFVVILLFGNKNYGEHLGYIVTRCQHCQSDRVFSVSQRRQRLTVYFIPTVQYRVKQYMTCQGCGRHFEIADALKPQIAERLMTESQLKKVVQEMTVGANVMVPLCQSCSQPVGRGMRYCPSCGTALQ